MQRDPPFELKIRCPFGHGGGMAVLREDGDSAGGDAELRREVLFVPKGFRIEQSSPPKVICVRCRYEAEFV